MSVPARLAPAAAIGELARAHALAVDESGRLDPKIPAGRIALQEPAPGAITRRQRSIRVWVSQGPRITIIPALTGESERAAQLRDRLKTLKQRLFVNTA